MGLDLPYTSMNNLHPPSSLSAGLNSNRVGWVCFEKDYLGCGSKREKRERNTFSTDPRTAGHESAVLLERPRYHLRSGRAIILT